MTAISYGTMVAVVSAIWCIVRAAVWAKNKKIDWKRELQLLLVYVCFVVIVRFIFCPFEKVDGKIQPLLFDINQMLPFRINLLPFTYLFDYDVMREAIVNLIGNIMMFVPVGIVYPIVYRKLDTHAKVIAAGVGLSLAIEILQLPFFDRVTDIDDLILNSTGYILGYLIYLGVKRITKRKTADCEN